MKLSTRRKCWDWDETTDIRQNSKRNTLGSERKEHLSTAAMERYPWGSPPLQVGLGTPAPTLARLGLKASPSAPETAARFPPRILATTGTRQMGTSPLRREAEVRNPVYQSQLCYSAVLKSGKSFLYFPWLSGAPLEVGVQRRWTVMKWAPMFTWTYAALCFFISMHNIALAEVSAVGFLTCDQTSREGKDVRPRVPSGPRRRGQEPCFCW